MCRETLRSGYCRATWPIRLQCRVLATLKEKTTRMSMAEKIRIGAVEYLNTKPLVYNLAKIAPSAEVVFDVPSRLADRLKVGELDVALIPSIEFFDDPEYRIVSDACIACRGPVMSVKLFSRVATDQIATLALDEGSRTSAALVQILLKERHGLTPRIESLPLGATLNDTSADAVLLIGDRAIHSPPGRFAEVWDLGDEWSPLDWVAVCICHVGSPQRDRYARHRCCLERRSRYGRGASG